MTPLRFAVTWDYRCPFARIAHDHVVEGLLDGADWDVTFVPFSLGQAHVPEGEPPMWERPGDDSGLVALRAGVVVRDRHPDRFPVAHRALFDARHVHGLDLRQPDVVADVLTGVGLDGRAVVGDVLDGAGLDVVAREHDAAVLEHDVWGVPTFLAAGQAVFVRLMRGPEGDAARARATVERVVETMVGWPELNEYKHTTIDR